MKVYILQLGEMANCTYVVGYKGKALIIDPTWDMKTIYKLIEEEKLKPEAVLFTHGHYDHVTGSHELMRKYRIKGYIHSADAYNSGLPEEDLITYNGDFKTKIAGLTVEFLSTPGHTKGSVCIKIGDILFTGDTLFPNACGRTDLPGSDPRDMSRSLRRLAALPGRTIVYAGHSYGADGTGNTTMEKETQNNPFIKMALREPDSFENIV